VPFAGSVTDLATHVRGLISALMPFPEPVACTAKRIKHLAIVDKPTPAEIAMSLHEGTYAREGVELSPGENRRDWMSD
jgi:hypothetical protein